MKVIVTGSEAPLRADIDAFNELEAASRDRVVIAQGRAEKWLAAITALTGLLATVLILKAPEKASEVEEGVVWVVAVLVLIALFLLAMAIQAAYSAAHGDTTNSVVLQESPVEGLYARRLEARLQLESATFAYLRTAIGFAMAGVIIVGVASVLLWTGGGSKDAAAAAESRCLSDENGVVVELTGATVTVSELREGVTIGACPK